MTIDKINQTSKIVNTNKRVDDIRPSKKAAKKDSIKISRDAKVMAEYTRYVKMVKEAPDIRIDKVNIAKKNLDSHLGNKNIGPEVLKSLSDKIAKSLGL